jgi:hypothetical protein
MTRICRRTGAVRRFLGLRVAPPLHLSAAEQPRPSLPAAESIRRMTDQDRQWAIAEGYVREVRA